MENISVFDFDKTIYKGDSFIDFYKFVLNKEKYRIIYLPIQIFYGILYVLKLINSHSFKNKFLIFLNKIQPNDLNNLVEEFWRENKNFNPELIDRIDINNKKKIKTIIISASPENIINVICKSMNVDCLIATRLKFNNNHYQIDGRNCRGIEKINRLKDYLGSNYQIVEAYSDNNDDIELLRMAQFGYKIVNGKIVKIC